MNLQETTKSIVSRWIRIVIQLSLQTPGTTEGLIPQLIQMLRNNRVESIETHWIAATLWNKALDYHAYPQVHRFILNCRGGDVVNCNKWCQHAISVSRFVEDDGVLENTVIQSCGNH